MKIIPGSKRHRYVAIVSIVLVAVALVVGMVSWLSAPLLMTSLSPVPLEGR